MISPKRFPRFGKSKNHLEKIKKHQSESRIPNRYVREKFTSCPERDEWVVMVWFVQTKNVFGPPRYVVFFYMGQNLSKQ
jgi:hypothetical protein